MTRCNITVEATRLAHSAGATVTGYAIVKAGFTPSYITPCDPVTLSRIYRGYGQLRAETGPIPRRGFGQVIPGAGLFEKEINNGYRLWLRVED